MAKVRWKLWKYEGDDGKWVDVNYLAEFDADLTEFMEGFGLKERDAVDFYIEENDWRDVRDIYYHDGRLFGQLVLHT